MFVAGINQWVICHPLGSLISSHNEIFKFFMLVYFRFPPLIRWKWIYLEESAFLRDLNPFKEAFGNSNDIIVLEDVIYVFFKGDLLTIHYLECCWQVWEEFYSLSSCQKSHWINHSEHFLLIFLIFFCVKRAREILRWNWDIWCVML